MEKLSLLEQLCKELEPLLVPLFSVLGFIGTLFAFWKTHVDSINKIKIEVAIQSVKLQNIDEKTDKMDVKIDRINELVHQIKDQNHGVLNAATSEVEVLTDKVLTKFSEYDRKFAIVFNRQKRQVK